MKDLDFNTLIVGKTDSGKTYIHSPSSFIFKRNQNEQQRLA